MALLLGMRCSIMHMVVVVQLLAVSVGLQLSPHNTKNKQLILVTGAEGSGTTMVATILCQGKFTIGIPTDWSPDRLSEKRSRKYDLPGVHGNATKVKNVTYKMWADMDNTSGRAYIENGTDERNATTLENSLQSFANHAQNMLHSVVVGGGVPQTNIVLHRSMPFGTRSRSPFFEDLPVLAKLMGPDWSAHLVIVMREMPKTWLSHGHYKDSKPFLQQLEGLLANKTSVPGLTVTFLSYERLLCDPAKEIEVLSNDVGGNVTSLMKSPEITSLGSIASSHDDDTEYQNKYDDFRTKWDAMRGSYPKVDSFISNGSSSC